MIAKPTTVTMKGIIGVNVEDDSSTLQSDSTWKVLERG